MTPFDELRKQIQLLYAQVMLQKSLRLSLRAWWIGMTGILLGWLIHSLWGWLPNPASWLLIGLGFALIPIAGAVISLYPVLTDLLPPLAWIYALDSRLHQRHQLSTAWEMAQKGTGGPVTDLLVEETAVLLPQARAQILEGGWYRKLDLAAAGLATLLICGMLAALLMQPRPQPAAAPEPAIPQSGQQFQNQASSPNGAGSQPGDTQNGQNGSSDGSSSAGNGAENGSAGSSAQNSGSEAAGNNAAGSDTAGNQTARANSDNAGGDPAAAADALRKLGQELSQQAGTYDLGQALQNLEMNQAADALQDLKDQAGELSPESRENMSQAMGDAAKNLDQAKQPDLSQDMQKASDAMSKPDEPAAAGDALDQLAQDLRQLDGAMQASGANGSGAGQGQSSGVGQSNPADRLPNENGQMEIPQENTENSGLLSPARPDAKGEGTASGSLDAVRPQGSPSGQSPLLPSSFLWKWRDVVSQYFQR